MENVVEFVVAVGLLFTILFVLLAWRIWTAFALIVRLLGSKYIALSVSEVGETGEPVEEPRIVLIRWQGRSR